MDIIIYAHTTDFLGTILSLSKSPRSVTVRSIGVFIALSIYECIFILLDQLVLHELPADLDVFPAIYKKHEI